jgi:hypothetical protein
MSRNGKNAFLDAMHTGRFSEAIALFRSVEETLEMKCINPSFWPAKTPSPD